MATRSPAHPRPVRRALPQSVHTSQRKPRFRWLRRLLAFLIVAGFALAIAYGYILQVYAPGLRGEARRIPSIVHAQLAQHNATYVVAAGITPNLKHAIVAIEDRRFYLHPGIDPIGVIRAAIVNLQSKQVDQGGSTLEEQLVKRTLVPDNSSVHAKLREAALAWAVDQEFSKRQVLELYLNAAYYGQGAYGADAAAHAYFGADPLHLDLAQAAFLAALPQAPSIYGSHPTSGVVIARQHTVLDDMVAAQYITEDQARAAKAEPLHFAFPNPR